MRLNSAILYVLGGISLANHIPTTFAQLDSNTRTSSSDSSASVRSCAFSCPPTNLLSWALVKRPFTVGVDSYYSIFECVYATSHPSPYDAVSEHRCSYNKRTGVQTMVATGDNCLPRAIPCSISSSFESTSDSTHTQNTPQFSHIDGEEVYPWIEGGRFLLYLKEHPPA